MQKYSNHLRFNPLHHFIIIPLSVFLISWTLTRLLYSDNSAYEKVFFIVVAIFILLITLITRFYALKNQDRIIRLEIRLRYFELTGKQFSLLEDKLSISQIIALRFARDDELLFLIDKTISQEFTNKEIKKRIKNWTPDLHRV
jgi:uncharacterized membrane protein